MTNISEMEKKHTFDEIAIELIQWLDDNLDPYFHATIDDEWSIDAVLMDMQDCYIGIIDFSNQHVITLVKSNLQLRSYAGKVQHRSE